MIVAASWLHHYLLLLFHDETLLFLAVLYLHLQLVPQLQDLLKLLIKYLAGNLPRGLLCAALPRSLLHDDVDLVQVLQVGLLLVD